MALPIGMLPPLPSMEAISASWMGVAEAVSRVQALEAVEHDLLIVSDQICKSGFYDEELWAVRAKLVELRERLFESLVEDVQAAIS